MVAVAKKYVEVILLFIESYLLEMVGILDIMLTPSVRGKIYSERLGTDHLGAASLLRVDKNIPLAIQTRLYVVGRSTGKTIDRKLSSFHILNILLPSLAEVQLTLSPGHRLAFAIPDTSLLS